MYIIRVDLSVELTLLNVVPLVQKYARSLRSETVPHKALRDGLGQACDERCMLALILHNQR
jgi:hypothetical protein